MSEYNYSSLQFSNDEEDWNLAKFKKVRERFNSYETWKKFYIDPLDLAKAGFYYLMEPDKVKCYQCGIILSDWCVGDDPWAEHAFWNPKCIHVMDKKGDEFINDVIKCWRKS